MCSKRINDNYNSNCSLQNVFTSWFTHSADFESLLLLLLRTPTLAVSLPCSGSLPRRCHVWLSVRLPASSEQSNEPIVLGPNVSFNLLRAAH